MELNYDNFNQILIRQQQEKIEMSQKQREIHEAMLKTAREKNEEDIQKKKEVNFNYFMKINYLCLLVI